ncbi:MAG: type II toxin-antitoxin system RelB/DinJ family antitoxin [Eggerthellaceae bacterium]|nr:type II toxin-antitoxin system RelB/DinJ family antitoxin [Eggerthellaceae bacterium]
MNVQVSTRVEKSTRDAAAQALEADGLDLSTGIRMFLKRTADLGMLPFAVGSRGGFVPGIDLQRTVAEAKAHENLSPTMGFDEAMSYLDKL